MATVMTDERRAAGRALMAKIKELRTGKGPLATSEELNRPTVLILDTDLASDLVERMSSYEPPVVLAIYYTRTGQIRLLGAAVQPGWGTQVTASDAASTVGEMISYDQHVDTPGAARRPQLSLRELVSA